MVDPATLATVHGGAIPGPLTVVAVVAGLAYVMWRRMQGEPLQARRLVVLPLIFSVLGVVNLTGAHGTHLGTASVAFLVAGAVISVVLGAARGATVELFAKGGHLWQRYRGVTVALWGALIAAKLALALATHLAGATGNTDLMLSLGLSLAGEAALVAPRALSSGVPFAPDPKRPDRSRPGGAWADPMTGPGPHSQTWAASRWDNRAGMPTPPQENDHDHGGEPEWRSPGWREGLDWARYQLDQPGRRERGRR